MKTSIVTGITGQDGAYLAKLLLSKGHKVIGARRRNTCNQYWRLDRLGITKNIEFVDFDLTEPFSAFRMIEKVQPDEVYNLAAQSFVGLSFDQPYVTTNTIANGTLNLLESIRTIKPNTRFYQASTSEMFGKVREIPQTEITPFYPRSPYGCAKAYAHYLTVNYREAYNMFACSGILFNHESPLRGDEFVTQKIVKGLLKWKKDGTVLELGNLDSLRDWGHAEDYVHAMYLMLQQKMPDDYVIATGETQSVRMFIRIVLDRLNIKFVEREHEFFTTENQPIIRTNVKFYRPTEVDILVGDSTKAKEKLLWTRTYTFIELVEDMITKAKQWKN